jgi:fructose-1,6-bisphosphatase/inositol monophosphatase family enzyme
MGDGAWPVPPGLVGEVAGVLREVAAELVTPRFRRLAAGEVTEKSPGEVVTTVDHAVEARLVERLGPLWPGAPVVGEEAAAADPGVLHRLEGGDPAWVVDPLDGTAGFVAGSPDHAVMVALVADGRTVASWIWRPALASMVVAVRGAGATLDGAPLRCTPAPPRPGGLRGVTKLRFLDRATAASVAAGSPRLGRVGRGVDCAGIEYPLVAGGGLDFVLYGRTLPWDHAPGALVVEEAGGVARRFDGSPYAPGRAGHGLLVAADATTWELVHDVLLAGSAPSAAPARRDDGEPS